MPSQLTSNSSSWKQEVNRRVAAHKNRKGPARVEPEHLALPPRPAASRAAEVAARVSARYAKAPSYNNALVEEARAAVRTPVAAQPAIAPRAAAVPAPVSQSQPPVSAAPAATMPVLAEPVATQQAAYEVRWSDQLPEQRLEPAARAESALETPELVPQSWQGTAEQESLLETPAIEVVDGGYPIPGNLIQFPRELVSPRKSRRSYDEEEEAQPLLSIFEVDPATVTPLLDEPVPATPAAAWEEQATVAYAEPSYAEPVYAAPAYAEPAYSEPAATEAAYAEPHRAHFDQEQYAEPVYAEQAYAESTYAEPSYEPATYATAEAEAYPDALTPRWAEEQPEEQAPVAEPVRRKSPVIRQKLRSPELELAPMSTRLLAGVVNISLMLTGLVLAGLMAARGDAFPGIQRVEVGAVVGLALIALLYTSLFYLLSDSTPGMRYAHLRLVKFDGRRSTRADRFVRIGCLVLSALPLGAGFLSMLWDEENLCWHDKLSRTYLRRY